MSFFISKDGRRMVGLGDNGSAICLVGNKRYTTEPIRSKKHGLGWRVHWTTDVNDYTDYFMDKPDLLQQEILAVEQLAKLRKQKQQNKKDSNEKRNKLSGAESRADAPVNRMPRNTKG